MFLYLENSTEYENLARFNNYYFNQLSLHREEENLQTFTLRRCNKMENLNIQQEFTPKLFRSNCTDVTMKRMKRMQSMIAVMPTISEDEPIRPPLSPVPSADEEETIEEYCQVCFKTISHQSNNSPVMTSCGHLFCKKCFKGSFTQKLRNLLMMKPKCPACNEKLSRKKPYVTYDC